MSNEEDPGPGDPWADPGYHPDPAPPMSDGFNRVIGDYCRAENAKTPGPERLGAGREIEAGA